MNAPSLRRLVALAAAVATTLLAAGCIGGPSTTPSDPTSPRRNAAPPRLPSPTPGPPVPTGASVDSTAQFDANPCTVATSAELGVALAAPYHLLAANTLAPQGPPSTLFGGTNAIACGYTFTAPTDSSDAYHTVVVRVTRWKSGGDALLAGCRQAAAAQPNRYRTVALADEACLGPSALMPIRSGTNYYSVTVTAQPVSVSTPDEDVSIGAMTLAAAQVVAARLP
jgi:hypothetical protein